ncbi:hypothetical protein OAQ99_01775 [Candidatus Kapabacteria bacterium]|nr:hypothetical protein [Candidatus Kapabacteria bacterium]
MEKLINELANLPVFIQVIIGGVMLFLLYRIFKNALKLLFWILISCILIFLVVYFFDINLNNYINNGV